MSDQSPTQEEPRPPFPEQEPPGTKSGGLAPLYVFLAIDDARCISGEVVGATGGKPLH
jgi:hypothetical protein